MDVFSEILNKPSGEAPKPQALPIGTYLTVVDGPYKPTKVGQDQTDCVEFVLKILSVMEADPSEVSDYESAQGGSLLGKTINARFFLTDKALYRLDEFLEIVGIAKGLPYKQALAEVTGKQVVINVSQRPSPDGTRMFSDIKGYARP